MKWPEPGRVKTRLAPRLGEAGAARLYRWLLARTIQTAEEAARHVGLDLLASFSPRSRGRAFRDLLGQPWRLTPQAEGSLGDRLLQAFEDCFSAGRAPVLAIGSDCPWVTVELVREACARLKDVDVVFGPAQDGGYYLIGLNRMEPRLFQGIPWSSAETLARSIERARSIGLRLALLEELADVDRPQDLVRLKRDFSDAPVPFDAA